MFGDKGLIYISKFKSTRISNSGMTCSTYIMVQGPTMNNNQSLFYKKQKNLDFSPTGTSLSFMAGSCKISFLPDVGGAKVL